MDPILILKTGTAVDCVRAVLGDFEDWFIAALGEQYPVVLNDCTTTTVVEQTYCAVIVTGSVAMVSDREEWSERTGAWLKKAETEGIPVLAVCYGHQLLAQALGGTVGANPNGRQIGTRQAQLTTAAADDALFSSLPASFKVQASHVESVLELPEGAVLLARTDTDPNYAYRIGDSAWGIQFHPEFSADATRAYIKARKEALISEGLDPDELYSNVQETPVAHALIRKFADLVKDGTKGKAA